MGTNRTILLTLCGLCMLAGVMCAFLGFTGQQGVGYMALAAVLCTGVAGPGLSCALMSKPHWWARTLVYLCSTLLILAALSIITLRLTGNDFSQNSEFWHLNVTKSMMLAACAGLLTLSASIAVAVHSVRVVKVSDPLGPLDWNTQSTRYSDQLASGRVQPVAVQPRGDGATSQAAEAQPPKRFIAGITPVSQKSLTPSGIQGANGTSVPDGVLQRGAMPSQSIHPVPATSGLPYVLLTLIAIIATAGAGGAWYLSRGPRAAQASDAIATTAATHTYQEWGFGFDVPGAPFEQIDPQQFSSRAVLAVSRKEPAMRFYVIAERREDSRSLEEATRVLREAMSDIAPGATTLLDNAAQLEGINGWRLLTRVRVGATDTFYCHWLGDVKGVSLQLWVVGTGKDAQSFAREADTLFDRFFLLKEAAKPLASGEGSKQTDKQTDKQADKTDQKQNQSATQPSTLPASTVPASTQPTGPKQSQSPAAKKPANPGQKPTSSPTTAPKSQPAPGAKPGSKPTPQPAPPPR